MSLSLIYATLSLVSGLILLVPTYWGWRKRHARSVSAYIALTISAAVWSLLYAAELLATDIAAVVTFAKLEYLGIATVPTLWLIFALKFAGYDRLLTRNNIIILLIVPIFILLMVWTNEWHQLFWQTVQLNDSGGFLSFDPVYGIGFWAHTIYSYGLFLIVTGILLQIAFRNRNIYRKQAIGIFLCVAIPWTANLLHVTRLSPLPGLDLTPISFMIVSFIVMWILLRFQMLDIVPVAYHALVANLPDGVMALNTRGCVVTANPSMERLLGIAEDRLIGSSFHQLFPGQSNLPVLSGDDVISTRAELFFDRKYIDLQISPMFDHSRQLQGLILVFRDITQPKQAEEELNRRLAQLALLHQIDQQIVSKLDLQALLKIALEACRRFSRADRGFIALRDNNEMRIAILQGYYPANVNDQTVFLDSGVIGEAIRNRNPVFIPEVSTTSDYRSDRLGTTSQIVLPLISQDRLLGVVNLEKTSGLEPFKSDDFDFLQLLVNPIALAVDNARLYEDAKLRLDELEGLYDAVSRLETIKTDMIRMASHDLINPLGVIQGLIDLLLLDRDKFAAEHVEYFEDVRRATENMHRIINGMLSLERIEEMATTENLERIDLKEVVRQFVEEYATQARDRNIRLSSEIQARLDFAVLGDRIQLQQAIKNLIGNAIKYTPPGGSVSVELSGREGCAVFEVKDTGFGIPEDQRDRIFEPFFRVSSIETQEIDGTGLGLHLVKKFVNRHGATLIFNSVYGEGSNFGFIIPILPHESSEVYEHKEFEAYRA